MSREQLSHLLSDMADDVREASVHQEAIKQSRRGSAMRATVAGVAALAILGGGAAGAATLYAGGPDNTPAASGDAKIDGTFIEATFSNPDPDEVFGVRPGAEPEQFAQLEDDGLYYHTGSVSPDGKNIVYYTSDEDDNGKTKVADLESGESQELGDFVWDDTCTEPVWAPDGKRVFIDRGAEHDDERFGFVDIETQEFSPSAQPPGCDVQVATDENGEDLLYSLGQEQDRFELYVTTPEGETKETGIADVAEDVGDNDEIAGPMTYLRELTAISPDGEMACLSTNNEPEKELDGQLDRYGNCDFLVNLHSGKPTELAFDGEKGLEGDFWSGGPSVFAIPDHFLVKASIGDERPVWQLYNASGELVDEQETVVEEDDSMGWDETMSLHFLPNDG